MNYFKHIIITLLLVSVSLATFNVVSAKDTVSADSLTAKNAQFFVYASNSLIHGLRSEQATVIDYNLNHIVIFKTDFPEFQSAQLQEELGNIILNGPNSNVRYKAFLTLTYLDHQDIFGNLNELKQLIRQEDAKSVFLYLNDKVNSDFILSANMTLPKE